MRNFVLGVVVTILLLLLGSFGLALLGFCRLGPTAHPLKWNGTLR